MAIQQGFGAIGAFAGGTISDKFLGCFKYGDMVGDILGDSLGEAALIIKDKGFDWSKEDFLQLGKEMIKSAVTNSLQQETLLEPVDSARGLLTEEFVDFKLLGVGYDLLIKRFYNSKSHKNSLIGVGWNLNIFSKVYKDEKVMGINLPDDSYESFILDELGAWQNIRGGAEQYKIYENPIDKFITLTMHDKMSYV